MEATKLVRNIGQVAHNAGSGELRGGMREKFNNRKYLTVTA